MSSSLIPPFVNVYHSLSRYFILQETGESNEEAFLQNRNKKSNGSGLLEIYISCKENWSLMLSKLKYFAT